MAYDLNAVTDANPTASSTMDVVDAETIVLDWSEPPDEVTVTTPADTGETSKPVPKLMVPAEPTMLLSSLISIPVPDAITPVSAEPSSAGRAPDSCPAGRLVRFAPSPLSDVAVTPPVTVTPVLDVCNLIASS